jgi:hypothetical protein
VRAFPAIAIAAKPPPYQNPRPNFGRVIANIVRKRGTLKRHVGISILSSDQKDRGMGVIEDKERGLVEVEIAEITRRRNLRGCGSNHISTVLIVIKSHTSKFCV